MSAAASWQKDLGRFGVTTRDLAEWITTRKRPQAAVEADFEEGEATVRDPVSGASVDLPMGWWWTVGAPLALQVTKAIAEGKVERLGPPLLAVQTPRQSEPWYRTVVWFRHLWAIGRQVATVLMVVDGSGLVHRAYHATKDLMSAPDGTPTGAVVGFMRLLLGLIQEKEPSHLVVVFDPPGGSFRKAIWSGYKANRPPKPDDLVIQLALCREATRALGLACLEAEGFEADDVMATVAKRWAADGGRCVLATADKDLMQVVSERVTLWDGKEKSVDVEAVKRRFGVRPDQVADVLAIAGDTSDNIPGVKGLGEKFGGALIATFGSLAALKAEASTRELSKPMRRHAELVLEQWDQAELSLRLSKIRDDVPVELPVMERRPPDAATLAAFLHRLGARGLLRDLGLAEQAVAPAALELPLAPVAGPRPVEAKLIEPKLNETPKPVKPVERPAAPGADYFADCPDLAHCFKAEEAEAVTQVLRALLGRDYDVRNEDRVVAVRSGGYGLVTRCMRRPNQSIQSIAEDLAKTARARRVA